MTTPKNSPRAHGRNRPDSARPNENAPSDEVFDPPRAELSIAGRDLTITPITLGEMPAFSRAAQPGVPVFAHTYDYPPVSMRWWWWHAGPWVSPVMRAAGVPRDTWDSLTAMMINDLAIRLRAVAKDWPALRIVDTRGCLPMRDWRNEIHPRAKGYAALAHQWRRSLDAIT